MASLMELVERVNKGESVNSDQLEVYQDSSNSAEKFLAHHANALLDLRRAHQHMIQSLEAIEFGDQKVLSQYVSVSGFLGITEGRAQAVVKFGSSAINRRDYSLGVEAIASAVAYDLQHGGSFSIDRENCQFVAGQYDRVSQAIGFNPSVAEWQNKQTKIAWVVSGLADDDAATRSMVSLARQIDGKRFSLFTYSTEALVRREKQQYAQSTYVASSSKRGRESIEGLGRVRSQSWLAPIDGDYLSAAKQLAEQMVKDRIDVAIFDVTQADAIAAIVSGWDVARVKVNLCRRTPLYSPGISNVIYFDPARFEADKDFWTRKGVQSQSVLEGVDLDESMGTVPLRSAYGIPDQAVILATAGNELDRTLSEPFVETVINTLRAHPHAVYLLIGDGELGWQKRKFESAGVAKRVGFAGKRKDLTSFLRMVDIYLCEFPASSASGMTGGAGVLQAMAAEKPIVAACWGEEPEQCQAALFVGSEGTIAGRDTTAYSDRVSKLIREGIYRTKLGKVMRQRVEQHFALNQTARQIEQFCDQLIQARSAATSSLSIADKVRPVPLAAVA